MTQYRLLCEKGTFYFSRGTRAMPRTTAGAKSCVSPFPGDTVRITIGGIGELSNPVVEGE